MGRPWRETPYGEWYAEGVGVVVDILGVLWLGYRANDNARVGPFRSRQAAQRALEQWPDDAGQAPAEVATEPPPALRAGARSA
jgi:hypothetical protein